LEEKEKHIEKEKVEKVEKLIKEEVEKLIEEKVERLEEQEDKVYKKKNKYKTNFIFIYMVSKGTFGYIIGRKKRFSKVNDDAELLWQILVREIYVIMNHYKLNKEVVKEAFEKIKVIKDSTSIPKTSDVVKFKKFANMESSNDNDWQTILYFCQSSFINLLESGCILLEKEEEESTCYHFEFDFNKWEARFYWKKDLLERATLDEIMGFEEMPTKTYNEIIEDKNERFEIYYDKVIQVELELEKLNKLKSDASSQGAANIEDKVDKLLDDIKWELKELHMSRREFYHRLKLLDLLENHL